MPIEGANPYDRGMPEVVLGCAAYYRQWKASPPAVARLGTQHSRLEASLKSTLASLAKIQANNYPGWIADRQNPGFLIKQPAPLFLRVPVHLLPLFPNDVALDNLYLIAHRVKIDEASIVYISGSNAIKDVMEYVSDVDFCEYIPKEGRQLSDSLLLKLEPNEYDLCIQIKFSASTWTNPFDDRESMQTSLQMARANDPKKSSFKIDYISKSQNRAFDVSTIGIVCNSRYESEGFEKTFAYQEAQMTATDWVPNRFCNVLELGRYVEWLIARIKEHKKEGNYAKALKRALSLARVCWIRQITNDIKYFFENTSILIDMELREVEELGDRIKRYGGNAWSIELDDLAAYLRECRIKRQLYEVKEQRIYGGNSERAAEDLISKLGQELARRSLGSVCL